MDKGKYEYVDSGTQEKEALILQAIEFLQSVGGQNVYNVSMSVEEYPEEPKRLVIEVEYSYNSKRSKV